MPPLFHSEVESYSVNITYLFIKDFVSTSDITSKILDAKYRKEQMRPHDGVSDAVKYVVWTCLLLANLAMFLTILILSFEMTNLRQNAWIITMCMWIGIDLIMLGFGQVIWSDVFIPSLIYDEVNKVKGSIQNNREIMRNSDNFAMPSSKFMLCPIPVPLKPIELFWSIVPAISKSYIGSIPV